MSTELTHEQQIRRLEEGCMVAGAAMILRAMKEHYGEEVYQIIVEKQGEHIRNHFKKMAEENGDNSIEAYIKLVYDPCLELGNEFTVEKTEDGYQMYCTKCMPYDGAKRFGVTEEAYYITCSRDPYMVEGFNPNIGLKRTKTRMQGHDCCDHFFYYKDKNK